VNAYLTWNDLSCLKRRVMVVFLESVSQLTSEVLSTQFSQSHHASH